jgi:hypothetical protein
MPGSDYCSLPAHQMLAEKKKDTIMLKALQWYKNGNIGVAMEHFEIREFPSGTARQMLADNPNGFEVIE